MSKKTKRPEKPMFGRTERLVLTWVTIIGVSLVLFFAFKSSADANRKIAVLERAENIDAVLDVNQSEGSDSASECSTPSAAENVTGPKGWTEYKDVVNGEANYNYVRFRSPDFEINKNDTQVVKGAQISFIVACSSSFTSVTELIDYETANGIFAETDQDPTFFAFKGRETLQYFDNENWKPPFSTVVYEGGFKLSLQYDFPETDLIPEEDNSNVEEVQANYAEHLDEYVTMLDTINFAAFK